MVNVDKLLVQLTDEQKQLIKDTLNWGDWGSTDMEFVNQEGEIKTFSSEGYIVNKAKEAGHFNGRKVAAMFRSIYKKLCIKGGCGEFLTHISNWWGNGSGDVIFIRDEYITAFEEWAKNDLRSINK